ncbi:MAG: hypothetical protein A2284_00870 [Deltaproteobacteria bacterium RIFOXYA12_FULL_61_11]|nr:MAG: hypothetical protein A2284_00870 [Deltaproteobacteria bacterium RIFOXYA12_FULL_61_11]
MDLTTILTAAVRTGASDIHLRVNEPPVFRVNGLLLRTKQPKLTNEQIKGFASSFLTEDDWQKFRINNQLDLAHTIPDVGRFRVNIFMQQRVLGIVFRIIPFRVKTLDELSLPEVLKDIAMTPRGLVLVTGATGSGKSTTLAAMIEHLNQNKPHHVITVEDPIEYLFKDNRCVINQREIGQDAPSFNEAFRAALRQDPDIILVGEMRDLETIDIALKAAETGHLVLSTLHTTNAVETANRIIAVFPNEQQRLVRHRLAMVLKSIISQRLVRTADGKGRLAANEILINTRRVMEILDEGEDLAGLADVITEGYDPYRMQTFDQHLMYHLKLGRISYDEAMANSTNAQDFKLRFQGIHTGGSGGGWVAFDQAIEAELEKLKNAPAPSGS